MIRVFELMAQETSAAKTSDLMIRLNVFSFLGETNCRWRGGGGGGGGGRVLGAGGIDWCISGNVS